MPIDYNRYPPDWKERRERLLALHHHTCQHCGAEAGASGSHDDKGNWHEESDIHGMRWERLMVLFGVTRSHELKMKTIILTIAHLDHDEENWTVTDDRLTVLCASCHLRYDASDNALRRKYGKYYRSNQFNIFQ